ncbi:MAG: PAS domain S-box protein [Proteobacteria bacterium]|nr:PAS domain S-box protein [Pseudomonadota bacterium]
MDNVIETGKTDDYEIHRAGADGQAIWYSTRVAPLMNDKGEKGVVLINRDISERKRRVLAQKRRDGPGTPERQRQYVVSDRHPGDHTGRKQNRC